jgi:hypothetical protein
MNVTYILNLVVAQQFLCRTLLGLLRYFAPMYFIRPLSKGNYWHPRMGTNCQSILVSYSTAMVCPSVCPENGFSFKNILSGFDDGSENAAKTNRI